jgi:hypothetical protein
MREGRPRSDTREASADTEGGGTSSGHVTPAREHSREYERPDRKENEQARELRLDEKRAIEIRAKWGKLHAKREKDVKKIAAHVELRRDDREARFGRMYQRITEPSGPEYRTGLMIQETEALEKKRLENLHAQWHKNVYEPQAIQAFNHINRERGGTSEMRRSVSFHLPGESFKLIVNMNDHPARKQLVEAGRERALRRAADAVLLGHSQSDPQLLQHSSPAAAAREGGPGPLIGGSGPRDIDPTIWNPVPLQGTTCGYFPEGSDIPKQWQRSHLKAGHEVFLPDESDDVLSAGTRVHHIAGHHDKGILVGKRCHGETGEHKTAIGCSSGAPGQDHYTFERNQRWPDLEWHHAKNTLLPGR